MTSSPRSAPAHIGMAVAMTCGGRWLLVRRVGLRGCPASGRPRTRPRAAHQRGEVALDAALEGAPITRAAWSAPSRHERAQRYRLSQRSDEVERRAHARRVNRCRGCPCRRAALASDAQFSARVSVFGRPWSSLRVHRISWVGRDPSLLFRSAEGLAYLDTATYGLAPLPTTAAMRHALAAWEAGTARWIEDWDVVAEVARRDFAAIVGVDPANVALLPAASVGVRHCRCEPAAERANRGWRRTSSRRCCFPSSSLSSRVPPSPRFRSTSSPTALTPRPISWRSRSSTCKPARWRRPRTSLLKPEQLARRVLLDATHGIPFVDPLAANADFVVCAAYKHLLCPRGTAFLTVGEDLIHDLVPWNANWRAADDPYARFVGGPLTLADSASRFDTSMAWHLWIRSSRLAWIDQPVAVQWSARRRPRQDGRARRPASVSRPTGSSIIAVPVADMDVARKALARETRQGWRAHHSRPPFVSRLHDTRGHRPSRRSARTVSAHSERATPHNHHVLRTSPASDGLSRPTGLVHDRRSSHAWLGNGGSQPAANEDRSGA